MWLYLAEHLAGAGTFKIGPSTCVQWCWLLTEVLQLTLLWPLFLQESRLTSRAMEAVFQGGKNWIASTTFVGQASCKASLDSQEGEIVHLLVGGAAGPEELLVGIFKDSSTMPICGYFRKLKDWFIRALHIYLLFQLLNCREKTRELRSTILFSYEGPGLWMYLNETNDALSFISQSVERKLSELGPQHTVPKGLFCQRADVAAVLGARHHSALEHWYLMDSSTPVQMFGVQLRPSL